MDKYQWLKEAMNGETINELANKAGISSATAWRQFNNDLNFTAENVILIARAYHKDPVEALVAFDYLREDERGAASSAPHSKTPPTTTCSPRSRRVSTATHRSPTSPYGGATPRTSTGTSPNATPPTTRSPTPSASSENPTWASPPTTATTNSTTKGTTPPKPLEFDGFDRNR